MGAAGGGLTVDGWMDTDRWGGWDGMGLGGGCEVRYGGFLSCVREEKLQTARVPEQPHHTRDACVKNTSRDPSTVATCWDDG